VDENGVKKKETLSLENTLWMDTVLANSQIWGLIIYTGKETRMSMNSRNPRSKFGRTDMQINFLSKLLFALMLFMALLLIVLRPPRPYTW
jgi:phospholipid-translocating ATPase